MRIRMNLNHDWAFVERCTDAFLVGEACPEARPVELPHSCVTTPCNYFDESVYQMVCGYRRTVDVPADWAGKRVFLHVGAAAHRAERALEALAAAQQLTPGNLF